MIVSRIKSWRYVITIDTKNEKENEALWDLIDLLKRALECGFPITIEATPEIEEVVLDESDGA